MATKRESILTKEYPPNDSKFPERAARGVEPMLPPFKPIVGQLGPYELICELGSGGMGTVYVARRTYEGGVTRTVALKTLRKDLAGQADLVEMFMDEARITSRISHPYVCTVMDIGSAEGVPFVTMDYLIGEPLSRLAPLMAAEQTEVSIASILRVVANLCEGLHAAHEQRDESGSAMQVVHRDISPDNLFVLYDGSVRVADFGIACTAEHQKSGKANALAGKSGYMSPEQIRGQMIDRRADVWSMGVVLWELLTGKRLFRPGSEVAATVAVLERPIDSPSKFNKLCPSGLDAVVRKALHRDRDHRYPTARAMALDLENVLTRCFGPVSAARVSGWLDDLFPGCQEFRRTIVPRSLSWLKSQAQLELHGSSASLTPGMMMLPQTASRELDLFAYVPSDLAAVPRTLSEFNISTADLESVPENTSVSSIVPVVVGDAGRRFDSLSSLEVELSGESSPPAMDETAPVAQPAGAAAPAAASLPPHRRFLRTVAIAFAGGLLLSGGIALLSSSRADPQAATAITKPAAQTAPALAPKAPAASAPVVALAPAAAAAVAVPREPSAVPAVLVSAPAAQAAQPALPATTAPSAQPLEAKPARHPKVAAGEKPVVVAAAKSETAQLGEVYAFAKGSDYVILINGKTIPAPVTLRLSPDTHVLFVRQLSTGSVKQVPVSPRAGSPTMVRLD